MPVLASTATSKQNHPNKNSNTMNRTTSAAAAQSITNQPKKHDAPPQSTLLNQNGPNSFTSRCPHVALIGSISLKDLEIKNLIAFQQRRKAALLKLHIENGLLDNVNTTNDNSLVKYEKKSNEEEEDEDAVNKDVDYLQCDECEKRKNLWVCLREDCMFVGCGQDVNSNKHSNLHSMVSIMRKEIFLNYSRSDPNGF